MDDRKLLIQKRARDFGGKGLGQIWLFHGYFLMVVCGATVAGVVKSGQESFGGGVKLAACGQKAPFWGSRKSKPY